MSLTQFIARLVNLEPLDWRLVREFAEEKGLGRNGFSAALDLRSLDF